MTCHHGNGHHDNYHYGYQITLPSGAYVKVANSYEDYVNVWFVPASSDYSKTEGKWLWGSYQG